MFEQQFHVGVHARRVLDAKERDKLPHQMVDLELVVFTHVLGGREAAVAFAEFPAIGLKSNLAISSVV